MLRGSKKGYRPTGSLGSFNKNKYIAHDSKKIFRVIEKTAAVPPALRGALPALQGSRIPGSYLYPGVSHLIMFHDNYGKAGNLLMLRIASYIMELLLISMSQVYCKILPVVYFICSRSKYFLADSNIALPGGKK